MATLTDYPPPQPIRTRKADLFHIDDYAELDKYACAVCFIVILRSDLHAAVTTACTQS